MVSYFRLLYEHLTYTPLYPTKPFTDQTIIVTGANVGLGLEAARHFVRLNAAKVILGVRNLEKGEAAKQSIEASEKREGVIEVWWSDLASYQSVRDFARRAKDLERLDVVVENAGKIYAPIYHDEGRRIDNYHQRPEPVPPGLTAPTRAPRDVDQIKEGPAAAGFPELSQPYLYQVRGAEEREYL